MSRSLAKKEPILPSWLHWQESKQRQVDMVPSVGFAVTTCCTASRGDGDEGAPGENITPGCGEGGCVLLVEGVEALLLAIGEKPDGDAAASEVDGCVMAVVVGKVQGRLTAAFPAAKTPLNSTLWCCVGGGWGLLLHENEDIVLDRSLFVLNALFICKS